MNFKSLLTILFIFELFAIIGFTALAVMIDRVFLLGTFFSTVAVGITLGVHPDNG